jgi:hypothetical protein
MHEHLAWDKSDACKSVGSKSWSLHNLINGVHLKLVSWTRSVESWKLSIGRATSLSEMGQNEARSCVGLSWIEWWSSWVKWIGSVSTSIRGVRFTLHILGGNEWFRFPRHSVSGSTLLGLTWDSWCGKGTAPGYAWCCGGQLLFRLHREPKGTKRSISPASPARLCGIVARLWPDACQDDDSWPF